MLAVCEERGQALPTLACLRCGSYATRVPRKLTQPCPGAPEEAGIHALRSLFDQAQRPGEGRGIIDAAWRLPRGGPGWWTRIF